MREIVRVALVCAALVSMAMDVQNVQAQATKADVVKISSSPEQFVKAIVEHIQLSPTWQIEIEGAIQVQAALAKLGVPVRDNLGSEVARAFLARNAKRLVAAYTPQVAERIAASIRAKPALLLLLQEYQVLIEETTVAELQQTVLFLEESLQEKERPKDEAARISNLLWVCKMLLASAGSRGEHPEVIDQISGIFTDIVERASKPAPTRRPNVAVKK